MQLVNFSVTNFRSITSAHKILISKKTILIGKNNEGKSNVLKALNLAMNILQEHAMADKRRHFVRMMRARRPYRGDENSYYWPRDFPVALQERSSGTQTIFRLEFFLEDEEVDEFKAEIKSNLNGTLPIEIKIGKDNGVSIKVSKKGRGAKNLTSKSEKIASFIAGRIMFNYIPAVRTDREALHVIEEMLSQRLRILEDDTAYQDALHTIDELQMPILAKLAKSIKEPLVEFLPNIRDVKIEMPEQTKSARMRSDFEVIIDDGTPTSIEFKGDGVKSLAALSLLKGRIEVKGASIIAIEEPESHLHPAAIHQLNDVIESLAGKNQVIISTHNPLFVDRHNIKSNIIIEKGQATPAKNVREIRELLGIKASDNLTNAGYALVVEGIDDVISLFAILSFCSAQLAKAIKSNFLIIEPIGGAGNLSYKLSLLNNSLCIYHACLDNDDAGREAYQKAEDDGVLSLKNCTMVNCKGMSNSELEDCFEPGLYEKNILNEFGVKIDDPHFRSNLKWSERMRGVFLGQGKLWDKNIKNRVKNVVAKSVERNVSAALNPHKRSSVDALIASIESLVKS